MIGFVILAIVFLALFVVWLLGKSALQEKYDYAYPFEGLYNTEKATREKTEGLLSEKTTEYEAALVTIDSKEEEIDELNDDHEDDVDKLNDEHAEAL